MFPESNNLTVRWADSKNKSRVFRFWLRGGYFVTFQKKRVDQVLCWNLNLWVKDDSGSLETFISPVAAWITCLGWSNFRFTYIQATFISICQFSPSEVHWLCSEPLQPPGAWSTFSSCGRKLQLDLQSNKPNDNKMCFSQFGNTKTVLCFQVW